MLIFWKPLAVTIAMLLSGAPSVASEVTHTDEIVGKVTQIRVTANAIVLDGVDSYVLPETVAVSVMKIGQKVRVTFYSNGLTNVVTRIERAE
jgi:hypothetical protein